MPNYKILHEFEDVSLTYKNDSFEIYKAYKTIDNEDDKAFFIKIWNVSSSDLLVREIWLYEIRQLQSLKSYPNAQNYLSLIYKYHRDNNCFAIIYECNKPNEKFYNNFLISDLGNLEFANNYIFSKRRIEHPLNRKKLWGELLKVAYGIKILHEKGLLHRNISIDNLLITEGETEDGKPCISDFRLTGFDWLLSLNSFDNTPNLFKSEEETELSFDTDWYLFGKLIQHFLFINDEINISAIYDSLPIYLIDKEKSLIKLLMSTQHISNNLYKTNYIDYKFVIEKIEEIITSLGTQNATELNYILMLPNRFDVIQAKYSNDNISLQPEKLNEIISVDLDLSEVPVTRVSGRSNKYTYLLHGKEFIYKIESNFNRASSKYDWYKAKIKDIYYKQPSWAIYSSITKNFDIKISIDKNADQKSISWFNILNSFPEKLEISSESKPFLKSMLLCYSLEVSDYLAKIFIVNTQILSINNDSNSTFKVKISQQQLHDQYCHLIYAKPMKGLLNDLINRESSVYEKDWILSLKLPNNKRDFITSPNESSSDFDSNSFKIELIYDSRKDGYYIFTLSENSSLNHRIERVKSYFKNDFLYLYPKSLKGSYISILRKKNALNMISNNSLLIKSIVNPTDCTLKLDYPFVHIPETKKLDTSKKEIYKQILETYPNFVVQGPPGVGKTFLITTLVKQIFNDERNSRVILSAQSHSTVQVLYEELLKLGLPKDLIQVNEFSQEEDEVIDSNLGYNIEQSTTTNLMNSTLKDLFQSNLWKDGYNNYRSLKELMDEFADKNSNKYKSLQDKIIGCANIVLTTTNSKTIEDILKNETYADWTIMEESGKASGLELISPLMLAPKRLIIGDHRQLPAYFEKNLHKILERLTYQDLLVIYKPILNGIMKPDIVELLEINQSIEEIETVLNQDNSNADDYYSTLIDIQNEFNQLKDETELYFSLLHYLAVKSENIKEQNPSKTMGEIITEQYRMHPNISKLISYVFYQNRLTNNKANEKKFLDIKNRPFYYSSEYEYSDSLNKNSGIHFLNLKEPNEKKDIKSLEKDYTNEAEVYIIENILKSLNANNQFSKKPNLIILSPYKKQVDLINNKFHQLKINELLSNKGFEVIGSELCRTIDSFQGGEADLVIISLVRHNINNDIYRSLGFLLDMRRLNVMLSRAKFQMIIIGSLGMFHYWIKNAPQNVPEEIINKLKLLYKLITDPSQNIAEIIDVTDSVQDFF